MTGKDAADECNIKVVCRIRPQSEAEKKAGGSLIVKFPSNDTVIHSVSIHRKYLYHHYYNVYYHANFSEVFSSVFKSTLTHIKTVFNLKNRVGSLIGGTCYCHLVDYKYILCRKNLLQYS